MDLEKMMVLGLGTVGFFLSFLASPLWFLIGGQIPDIFSFQDCHLGLSENWAPHGTPKSPGWWAFSLFKWPYHEVYTRYTLYSATIWGYPSWISLVQCHYSRCQVFTGRGTTSAAGVRRDRSCLEPLQGIGEAAATAFGVSEWIFDLFESSLFIYVPYI